jgi:glycopeptide antibiotics resistance protein
MRAVAVLWLLGWAAVGLPWSSATAVPSFEHVRLVPFRDGRPLSQALNVAAFIPWGMSAVALGSSFTGATLSGAAISGATEVLQLFSTRRYPSTTDLILNTLGTVAGAALALRSRSRPTV